MNVCPYFYFLIGALFVQDIKRLLYNCDNALLGEMWPEGKWLCYSELSFVVLSYTDP